jgi:hypothetical protein
MTITTTWKTNNALKRQDKARSAFKVERMMAKIDSESLSVQIQEWQTQEIISIIDDNDLYQTCEKLLKALQDTDLQEASLSVLIKLLDSEEENVNAVFVSCGILSHIKPLLKPLETSPKVTAKCLNCLALLSKNASEAIKSDRMLPLINPLLHELMETHLTNAEIQQHACCFLNNLCNPLLQELVAAGSLLHLWRAHQTHPSDVLVQEYANACLYILLKVTPLSQLQKDICKRQQLVQGLVPSMICNPDSLQVQKYSLLVMTRATSPSSFGLEDHADNKMQATQALGLPHVFQAILTAMSLHYRNEEVAFVALELLKSVSRQSIDFCTSVIHTPKAFDTLIQVMQSHIDSLNIQDPAMACLRNLLSLRTSNKISSINSLEISTSPQIAAAKAIRTVILNEDNKCILDMIRTIGLVMSIHVQDAPIQAYGCDVMGRLAVLDEYNFEIDSSGFPISSFLVRDMLYSGNALRLALQCMRVHKEHLGVQDRAIVLLLRLSSYGPAFKFMMRNKEDDVYDTEIEEYNTDNDDEDGNNDDTQEDPRKKNPILWTILQSTKVPFKKEPQDRLHQLKGLLDGSVTLTSTRMVSNRPDEEKKDDLNGGGGVLNGLRRASEGMEWMRNRLSGVSMSNTMG